MTKFLRRLGSLAAAAVMLCSVVFSQNAVMSVSADAAFTVQDITSGKKVVKDYTIDKNEILYIREGGRLTIEEDVLFAVNGRLKIAKGGKLVVRGTIDITTDGLLSNSGVITLEEGSAIELDGRLWVNKNGTISGDGVVCVNETFSNVHCKGEVTARIQPPEPVEIDGVTYVGGVLLVNKQYSIPREYGDGIDTAAYTAYARMKKASQYDMTIVSGYRSYAKQESTFNYWCSIDGFEVASTYSAQPGQSEHQTGLAMDITSLYTSYGDTAEGKWLAENCHKYGFIIRYPQNKEHITGYMYEPWHVRYLGTSTAKLVHDSGLCLEEFLGVA